MMYVDICRLCFYFEFLSNLIRFMATSFEIFYDFLMFFYKWTGGLDSMSIPCFPCQMDLAQLFDMIATQSNQEFLLDKKVRV